MSLIETKKIRDPLKSWLGNWVNSCADTTPVDWKATWDELSKCLPPTTNRVNVSNPLVVGFVYAAGMYALERLAAGPIRSGDVTDLCHSLLQRAQVLFGYDVRAEMGRALMSALCTDYYDGKGSCAWRSDVQHPLGVQVKTDVTRRLEEICNDPLDSSMRGFRSNWWHWEHPTFWAHPLCVVLCDRPTRVSRNARGVLHSTTGPALTWGDTQIYAIDGVLVSEEVVLRPQDVTTLPNFGRMNTEEMRVFAQRVGWAKILDTMHTTLVDRWIDQHTGLPYELLSCSIGHFIKKQSPVTKQATSPIYMEPVPRGLLTAQAARKWQAMAAFATGEQEALRLVDYCNHNPTLKYDWEA